jgi:hypothetical protein
MFVPFLSVICATLLLGPAARGGIWPDQLGGSRKVSSAAVQASDSGLWSEYGLEETEQARYGGARVFTATAWRLKDPTGAFGAFEWQLPPGATRSKLTEVAAETPDGLMFLFGNYLFRFDGWKPARTDLEALLAHLPKLDQGPFPLVYLPAQGLVEESRRYAIGPVGLERFQPGIPPSVAAFSLGAEAEVARYRTPAGEMQMAVVAYPTPQMARQRLAEFQKLPGAMAKRTGPLVAVILSPADADAGERLLATVKWNAIVTDTERVPTRRDNVGDLIVNIFILIGFILVLFVAGGLIMALLRTLGLGTSGEAMTVLHLHDQPEPAQRPRESA